MQNYVSSDLTGELFMTHILKFLFFYSDIVLCDVTELPFYLNRENYYYYCKIEFGSSHFCWSVRFAFIHKFSGISNVRLSYKLHEAAQLV